MPSMVAPSWLGQDTTSIGAEGHAATCSPVVVSFFGAMVLRRRDVDLGNVAASLAMNATVCASALRLKPEPIHCSGARAA